MKSIQKVSPHHYYVSKLSFVEGANAFAQLKREVKVAGILERSYGYYTLLTSIVIGGFLFSVWQLIQAHSVLGTLSWSIVLAFFTVQIGGLLHDAGHRAIFNLSKNNDLAGMFFSCFISFEYFSWKERHNNHHANPNSVEDDTDVLDYPFLSFSEERALNSRGIFRKLFKFQPWFYFPIQPLYNLMLKINAFAYYLDKKNRKKAFQIGIYILSLLVWFILPFYLFGFAKGIFVILATNAFVGFYLANIFAPNHKGMPLIQKGQKLPFIEQQIVTSRNVERNWLIDVIYLGLPYQIEHHLFPNCPRNKLGLLPPYVKRVCKKYNIPYSSVGVVASNKMILSELNRIAKVV